MSTSYRENVLDLEPQGPLPSQIYWRRRGLALGIGVAVVGLVAAIVFAVVDGSAGADNADGKKTTAAQHANPQGAAPEEAKTPVVPPAEQAPPPSATPTAAVIPPPVLKEGDDCPDSTLAVKGITGPQYVVGEQPQFTMVVTNIGLVACKRDVGAAVLAAYVYSLDNQRLWSNLDCAPSNETLVKTFDPGEQVTTTVTWTGMGSAPQCPLPRQPIGPGTYNLVVQLGNLRSATVPFMLTEPAPDALPPPENFPAPDAPLPGN
ncbi:hypothetical protein MTER_02970 [Mycolicibacter terrae]|uniref:Uncharacterized protein n=1 Tax=Mycolicibacter terrae TaxID=1788 RepID=A0AAD1HUF1_9MYCO|nr:hypothetical protein MTER_02970 [Mycolicibacter terrae]SNV93203.1 membrane protein [Mycolicibacter terrae]